MAKADFDIIVIGAGSGGLTVSLFMNKAGFRVLLVDKDDHSIGGECLNDGCIPSKAMIHVSRLIHHAAVAAEFGLALDGKADLKKVLHYIQSKQEQIRRHENADYLQQQGMTLVLGTASFISRNTIEVAGEKYSGKRIVIATGSSPLKLTARGIEKVTYYDNESIFNIEHLPKKFLFVGAGPVSIEMAQAFRRLGSEIILVEKEDRILSGEDTALAQILKQQLIKEGIEILTATEIEEFPDGETAGLILTNGERRLIKMDAVFAGIGRKPNYGSLQLSKAGIETKDEKIVTDRYLRTTNKKVFVCGDVAGMLKFSHAAEQHGRLLLNNFFSPFKRKLNNDHMSWVVFTDPELATFGIGEAELKDRGVKYRRIEYDFSNDDRAVVDNYPYSRLVLFISKGIFGMKQKILGGSMIAPWAGEMIQELILACSQRLSINAIFHKIYPYPVASRVNQLAVSALREERLTPSVKKILKAAYKLFGG